jgi:hypothetical protein
MPGWMRFLWQGGRGLRCPPLKYSGEIRGIDPVLRTDCHRVHTFWHKCQEPVPCFDIRRRKRSVTAVLGTHGGWRLPCISNMQENSSDFPNSSEAQVEGAALGDRAWPSLLPWGHVRRLPIRPEAVVVAISRGCRPIWEASQCRAARRLKLGPLRQRHNRFGC